MLVFHVMYHLIGRIHNEQQQPKLLLIKLNYIAKGIRNCSTNFSLF